MRNHSYFDNVMTKFMINNRTDAWKTDINLLNIQSIYKLWQGHRNSWVANYCGPNKHVPESNSTSGENESCPLDHLLTIYPLISNAMLVTWLSHFIQIEATDRQTRENQLTVQPRISCLLISAPCSSNFSQIVTLPSLAAYINGDMRYLI